MLIPLGLAVTLVAALTASAQTQAAGKSIVGTAKNDVLRGGPGNDRVSGLAGRDVLWGNGGNDTLNGGRGPDELHGGAGNDILVANDGDQDTVVCGPGRDSGVADRIDKVAADCEAVERAGASPPPAPTTPNEGRVLRGTGGNDSLRGGRGHDLLYGEGGNDRLAGMAGNDRLDGGAGEDSIDGGAGDDVVAAADGTRDRIDCGTGRDSAVVDARDTVRGCESVSRPSTPTPPPPPPPNGSCTVASTSGCVPGSTLTYTNATWTCERALSTYGRLPLKVVMDYTNNGTPFGVRLGDGCTGDGNANTIDLILDIRGDGNRGPGEDAIRIMNESPGARDLQITGRADCGRRRGDAHQDGIQAIGGTNISFVDFVIGNYDAGTATCQGAGGVVFYSGDGGTRPQNMQIIRGSYIGCNHALNNGNPPNTTGGARDARFRSGRVIPAQGLCVDESGDPYFSSPPCLAPSGFARNNLTCQRWSSTRQRWEDS